MAKIRQVLYYLFIIYIITVANGELCTGVVAREHTSTYVATFSSASCMIEAILEGSTLYTIRLVNRAHGEPCTGSLLMDLPHRAQFGRFLAFEACR